MVHGLETMAAMNEAAARRTSPIFSVAQANAGHVRHDVDHSYEWGKRDGRDEVVAAIKRGPFELAVCNVCDKEVVVIRGGMKLCENCDPSETNIEISEDWLLKLGFEKVPQLSGEYAYGPLSLRRATAVNAQFKWCVGHYRNGFRFEVWDGHTRADLRNLCNELNIKLS